MDRIRHCKSPWVKVLGEGCRSPPMLTLDTAFQLYHLAQITLRVPLPKLLIFAGKETTAEALNLRAEVNYACAPSRKPSLMWLKLNLDTYSSSTKCELRQFPVARWLSTPVACFG